MNKFFAEQIVGCCAGDRAGAGPGTNVVCTCMTYVHVHSHTVYRLAGAGSKWNGYYAKLS